jgi:hypothetical protein
MEMSNFSSRIQNKKARVLWISMGESECKLQGVRSLPRCQSDASIQNEPEV